MESEKPKLKQVRRYASLVRAFAAGIDEPSEYLENLIELDARGNTVKETKFMPDGSPEEVSSFVYDDAGRLLEHSLEYVPDEASEKRVLERDGEGRILRETKYYGEMAGEHTDFTYAEDRIIEMKSFDEEGDYDSRVEVQYNEHKLPVSRITYDKSNAVQERREYIHGEDGLSVEERIFGKDGNLQKTSVTRLNADKREEQTVEKTGQGKIISATQSAYDDKGNLTERFIRDSFSKRHVFAYDEQNRCIEEAVYGEGGILMRRQQFEFDAEGRLLTEHYYEMDVTRGGRDKHMSIRYEYELYEA